MHLLAHAKPTQLWLVLGLVGFLPACAIEAKYDQTMFQCGDNVCPNGYHCSAEKVCEEDVLANPGTDGGGDSDSAAPEANPKVSTITDDFSSGSMLPIWTIEGVAGCAEQEDDLRLDTACGYQTAQLYSVVGSSASVRLKFPSAAATFALLTPEGVDMGLSLTDTQVVFYDNRNGEETSHALSPLVVNWWRLSHDGANLIAEGSSNGSGWTEIGRFELDADTASAMHVGLYNISGGGPIVVYDDFNILPN